MVALPISLIETHPLAVLQTYKCTCIGGGGFGKISEGEMDVIRMWNKRGQRPFRNLVRFLCLEWNVYSMRELASLTKKGNEGTCIFNTPLASTLDAVLHSWLVGLLRNVAVPIFAWNVESGVCCCVVLFLGCVHQESPKAVISKHKPKLKPNTRTQIPFTSLCMHVTPIFPPIQMWGTHKYKKTWEKIGNNVPFVYFSHDR